MTLMPQRRIPESRARKRIVAGTWALVASACLSTSWVSTTFGQELPPPSDSAPNPASEWSWPIASQPAQVEPGNRDDAWRSELNRPEVKALVEEMTRAMNGLRLPKRQPPYYLGYTLLEIEQHLVVGQLGSVVQNEHEHGRTLHVEVRVGSPELDNSHAMQEVSGIDFRGAGSSMPLGSDLLAMRNAIWLATDSAYREASEALEEKRAARSNAVDYEQRAADFSAQAPLVLKAPPMDPLPPPEQLREIASQVSSAFATFPHVHESVVTVAAWSIHRTLVTSEGSFVVTPTRVVEVTLEGHTQAPDGMPLSHRITRFGEMNVEALFAQAQALGEQLTELRSAPLAPDYVGPVLFSGEAAPQIVQELLGQSSSGTPGSGEGPLARRLQRRVLPTTIDVVDDPTLAKWNGEPLLGTYLADDEGVPGQRVQLVQDGMLETLLMSRTPSREIAFSNGHGRTGHAGWARGSIGNLILTTSQPRTHAQLMRQLLRSGEPAIEIERLAPRPFSSNGTTPPEVERAFLVAPDGKRTLIRGAALTEMQVRDLKDVLAAGATSEVYHILLNAGAYSIPASLVAPALLFEEVELKKPKRSPRLPKVLDRPALPQSGSP